MPAKNILSPPKKNLLSRLFCCPPSFAGIAAVYGMVWEIVTNSLAFRPCESGRPASCVAFSHPAIWTPLLLTESSKLPGALRHVWAAAGWLVVDWWLRRGDGKLERKISEVRRGDRQGTGRRRVDGRADGHGAAPEASRSMVPGRVRHGSASRRVSTGGRRPVGGAGQVKCDPHQLVALRRPLIDDVPVRRWLTLPPTV